MWILLFITLSFSAATERWIFLGDSITEGYGISKENAYPSLIEKKLNTFLKSSASDKQIKIINAGISGSTSASGLSRLKWHLRQSASLVFIALGANDGLRGQSVDKLKENLKNIITYAKSKNLKVVVAGMKMPQNYGKQYTKEFESAFKDVSTDKDILLIPFLLDGVAGEKGLNLSDGIHPNENGHKIMAEKLFSTFKGLL